MFLFAFQTPLPGVESGRTLRYLRHAHRLCEAYVRICFNNCFPSIIWNCLHSLDCWVLLLVYDSFSLFLYIFLPRTFDFRCFNFFLDLSINWFMLYYPNDTYPLRILFLIDLREYFNLGTFQNDKFALEKQNGRQHKHFSNLYK